MNITNIYKKSIIFPASIVILNAVTILSVVALSNDSVESSSNKTKTTLQFSQTDKDGSPSAKTANKGSCKVNPRLPSC